MSYTKSRSPAIGRAAAVSVILVIVIAAVAVGFYYFSQPHGPTTSQTSSSTSTPSSASTSVTGSNSTSTSTTYHVPSSLTYETYITVQYLDPTVDYVEYDYEVINNVYEYLLWFNGTSGTNVIPWLAKSYTVSSDHRTVNFTLRQGINFADGEQFNSTAAYFAINRGFVIDGAAPTGFGYGPAWIQQQLANTTLSSVISGKSQSYSKGWVDQVLGQNFIEITSPTTFVMHLQHFDGAFPYLWGTYGAPIMAPGFTMQHDVALWSSQGYTLPYPTLSGNEVTKIKQYFYDEAATCRAGPTAGGCGATYLDSSTNGSLAGTGPYVLKSHSVSTQNIILEANSNYWGGPYQFSGGSKIVPQIKTININYVPDQTTRELDLQKAAKSGDAVIIDVTNDHLYDVADRFSWLKSGQLVPVTQGVSLFGPYTSFSIFSVGLDVNVTSPYTGKYYKFQPFADIRLRLAFSDAINMSQINQSINNNMGQVAINVVPPNLPPPGSYNTSIAPRYKYNLHQVQTLLLDAMMHPIKTFTLKNGTRAPSGLFNNTFGCNTLSSGKCSSPVVQTVTLNYPTGDTFDETILNTLAGNINNISQTYNMGLTVAVVPLPSGQLLTLAFSGQLYSQGAQNWYADYPWVLDFVGPLLAPGNTWYAISGLNFPKMTELYNKAVNYSHSGDAVNLVRVSSQMLALSNQEAMFLYTIYPKYFIVMSSSIQGYFYNPSEPMQPGYYFATMY